MRCLLDPVLGPPDLRRVYWKWQSRALCNFHSNYFKWPYLVEICCNNFMAFYCEVCVIPMGLLQNSKEIIRHPYIYTMAKWINHETTLTLNLWPLLRVGWNSALAWKVTAYCQKRKCNTQQHIVIRCFLWILIWSFIFQDAIIMVQYIQVEDFEGQPEVILIWSGVTIRLKIYGNKELQWQQLEVIMPWHQLEPV